MVCYPQVLTPVLVKEIPLKVHKVGPMMEKSLLVSGKNQEVFCHLTKNLEERAGRWWLKWPRGGKRSRWLGYSGLYWHHAESVFSPVRPMSVDREWGSEQGAWHDQRMTREPEEESQPKQRLLLRFPCARLHTGWQRGRDMDSTLSQHSLLPVDTSLATNELLLFDSPVFYTEGILVFKANIFVFILWLHSSIRSRTSCGKNVCLFFCSLEGEGEWVSLLKQKYR